MSITNIQPSIRTDCVDFIIVSNNGIKNIDKLLIEAAKSPEEWIMHHFIVIYDNEEECNALKKWVNEYREVMPLPKVTACLSSPKNRKNVGLLRAQAIEQGTNPYIYFQDDDDPLPQGIKRRINMMESSSWLAIYGITKSVSPRGQTIEKFPVMVNNHFICDPIDATKMFPTYTHPLAALFKRSLFAKIPIANNEEYLCSSSYAFAVRLFNSNLSINFLPDVIRTVNHHAGNSNGIFEKNEAENIAKDINTWQKHITDEVIIEFQKNIQEALLNKSITTYREIDARVEEFMETGNKLTNLS